MPFQDLVLMPERDARRALAGERLAFSVLAPLGAFAGRGVLRVLRVRPGTVSAGREQAVELVCGYEAYEKLA